MTSRVWLPLRFTWGITSRLLLNGLIIITHYGISTMHTLTLSHHSSKTTCVREHFILSTYSCASSQILWYQILLLFLGGMVILVLRLVLILNILLLTFNINWRLRSNSIFGWSWTWFLWVCSMLLTHHLSLIHTMTCLCLTMWNTSTH
jgi:hypothetical protein